MQYRKLGSSSIEASCVSLGCWALVGGFNWGPQDEVESVRTVEAALGAGITFLDTAPAYGNGASEQLIGRALGPRRRDVVIATKINQRLLPERIATECEESLRRLATDYIDLYQLHWPDWETPLSDTIDALERLVSAGKIRAYGVSNFGPRDLAEAVVTGTVATNQLPYSLLWRAIEYDVQPICVEHNVGILCYSPLQQGLLTGKFRTAEDVPADRARTRHFSSDREKARHGGAGCEEETFAAIAAVAELCRSRGVDMGNAALAWLLSRPSVGAVIAGARNPSQVERNAAAADLSLDEPFVHALTDASERVRELLGRNVDPWMSEPRIR